MKKYLILFTATILALYLVIMPGFAQDIKVYESDIYTVGKMDIDNTVSGSGKLRYRSGTPVRTEFAGIMQTVHVQNGDHVKKGDLLYTYYKIDDAYNSMLRQYTGGQGISSLIGSFAGSADMGSIIEEAKKYCTVEDVTSGYDGTVSDICYTTDDILEKNCMVMKISDGKSLEITVNISENYIEQIKEGQHADVEFSAVKDMKYSGTVSSVSDEAEQTNGLTGRETTVEVTITLDDADVSKLRIGYSANCTIVTNTDKDVLVLPYEYIRTDNDGDYVFLLKNGISHKQRIKTGKEYKEGTQVLSGLSAGDRVIINSDLLFDGKKITINH